MDGAQGAAIGRLVFGLFIGGLFIYMGVRLTIRKYRKMKMKQQNKRFWFTTLMGLLVAMMLLFFVSKELFILIGIILILAPSCFVIAVIILNIIDWWAMLIFPQKKTRLFKKQKQKSFINKSRNNS